MNSLNIKSYQDMHKYGQNKLSMDQKYRYKNDLLDSPTLKLLLVLKQMIIPKYNSPTSQSFLAITHQIFKIKSK